MTTKRRITTLLGLVLALALAPPSAYAEPSQWANKHEPMAVGETVVVGPEGPANLNVTIRRPSAKAIKLQCGVATSVALSNDGAHGLVEWRQFAPSCKAKKETTCPAATMQVTLGQGILQASARYKTSFILETPAQFEVTCSGVAIPPFEGTMVMYPGDYDCVGNPLEGIDDADHDLKWKREAPPLTNPDGSTLSFTVGGFGYFAPSGQVIAAYFNGEPNDCATHGEEPEGADRA